MQTPSTPSSTAKWPPPSQAVRELLRKGAEIVLNAPPEWLEEIDEASFMTGNPNVAADDPVLMAATRRANRANLVHWAAANIEYPGAPVPTYVSSDMLTSARELTRRGVSDLMFNAVRSTQNAAWQRWMSIAFSLTSNVEELRELLDVSARSITSFIDGNMEAVCTAMDAEREERLHGTHADRRELVTQILEGTAVNVQLASRRLSYNLDQPHHAAVVWNEEASFEFSDLERVAQILARCAGTQEALIVMANAATLWVWVNGLKPLDQQPLQQAIKNLRGVCVAIGSTGKGIEGFRRGHLDALSAQRVVGRLQSDARLVHVDMVRLVSLMTHDPKATQQFIRHTLGDLAAADPVLPRTLYTFLQAGCNATLASEQMHAHRNTFLRRLARAEELLPRPLGDNRIHVAAALEALNWASA